MIFRFTFGQPPAAFGRVVQMVEMKHDAANAILLRCMIWVGTSGFQYPEWKGKSYPEKFAPKKMLAFYGERFNSTESNYTVSKANPDHTFHVEVRTNGCEIQNVHGCLLHCVAFDRAVRFRGEGFETRRNQR